jgi:hypothetical protein
MAGLRAAHGSPLPPRADGGRRAERIPVRGLPRPMSWADQGSTGCPGPRKDGADNTERGRLWPGLLSMSPPPGPGRASARRGHAARAAGTDGPSAPQLVRALALHGVIPREGSHLGSPLGPGRPVLIRSVSRRVGSVACVREDASPNEVPGQTTQRLRPHQPAALIHDQPLTSASVGPVPHSCARSLDLDHGCSGLADPMHPWTGHDVVLPPAGTLTEPRCPAKESPACRWSATCAMSRD